MTGIAGAPDGQEDPRADLVWGTIPHLVDDAATRHGSIEALVDPATGLRLTFAQLADEVDRYARGFVAVGVQPGERVAVWAPNCAEWMLGALGSLRAGATLVPLNTRFKGGEAAYVIRDAGATTLLTVRGFLGMDYPAMLAGEDTGSLERIVVLRDEGDGETTPSDVPAVIGLGEFLAGAQEIAASVTAARAAAVRSDDVSDLIFTSGTTGHPKGAVTTHAQSLRTFATWSSIAGIAARDRYLVVNPFFHTFGYKAGILACLMAGATVVPEPVFEAEAVLARIERERITVLPGPPTLYQTLLAEPRRAAYDLSSLRLGVTGAAVVPVELVDAMANELGFDTVLTAYGLTECCGTVTMCRRSDPPELVAATSGRAIPGLEVRVVDPNGHEVPAGSPGEVVVRGYAVMSGYWGNEAATAETIDAEGWLHTGDIAVMDVAGNVTITDRVKDMYVVGGFNAYPAEIEATLRRHEAVAQVAVVGVPDERLGEVGVAYVVPSAGASGDEDEVGKTVLSWSRGVMANYKVPRGVVLVDALPLNASGKVLKRELRERHAAGADRVVTNERSQ